MPTRPGIGDGAATDDFVAVHVPDRDLPMLVFCIRISEEEPPPVPMACQLGPGSATGPPPIMLLPFISHTETWPTAGVLHQDVGMTVVVEIACADRVPTRPGIGATGPPPMILLPFISQTETCATAGILHQDVGMPVVIEIACSDGSPARPGIGLTGPPPANVVAVHFPDRDLATARCSASGCRNACRH